MYNDTILMEGNLTISLKITYAYAHELTISFWINDLIDKLSYVKNI